MSYEKAKDQIKKLIQDNPNGIYTNNIIGSTLRILAKEVGFVEADRLVDELRLDKLYGITKSNGK